MPSAVADATLMANLQNGLEFCLVQVLQDKITNKAVSNLNDINISFLDKFFQIGIADNINSYTAL